MDPKLKTWIAETYEEMGMKKFIPHANRLLVRTFPRDTRSHGGIYFLKTGFYDGAPHETVLRGVVIESGKNCLAEPGDYILMQRLHFASIWKLRGDNQGSHVGWIYEVYLVGYLADQEHPITGAMIEGDPRRMVTGETKGEYRPVTPTPTAAQGDDTIGLDPFR